MSAKGRQGEELQILAATYRAFSAAFREPAPDPAAPKELEVLFQALPGKAGLPTPPKPPRDLQIEFRAVFGHNLSPDCPPYETQYGKSDVFRQTNALADLSGFYRAFGLELAEGDRRPDHLPVELEFASLLCLKEALAVKNAQEEKAAICRDARAKFLERHLASWLPAFAAAIERKNPSGCYAGLAKALAAFAAWDAASLGVEGDAPRPQEARREEPEDPCLSCFGGVDETL